MASNPQDNADAPAAYSWPENRRLEAWAGEVRVNVLRLAAILGFYGQHLLNYYVFTSNDAPLTVDFHVGVTAVVAAWSVAVLGLYYGLSRHWLPAALPYIVVGWDILMIVMLVSLAGGPKSPLVLLLFLVIASAPLRLCLRLVYLATLGCLAAYLLCLGYYAYFQIGIEKYYAPVDPGQEDPRIPRSTQIIVILALGCAGLLAGQSVRQVRRIGMQRSAQDLPES